MTMRIKDLAGASMLCVALFIAVLLWPRLARAAVEVYDVDAWIDTTDYLYINGSTLQWEHKTSGSPAGTHGGDEPTTITSTLDGFTEMSDIDWNQTWPSPLPSDAFSSIFTSLSPALPLTGSLSASVSTISGRGTPSIFQEPTSANDNTLIVQFTDGFDGAAFLDAQITVVPEPASPGLLGVGVIGILCLGSRSRRARSTARV